VLNKNKPRKKEKKIPKKKISQRVMIGEPHSLSLDK